MNLVLIKAEPTANWSKCQSYEFKNKKLCIDGEGYSGFLKIQHKQFTWFICEKIGGDVSLCGHYFVKYPVCLFGPTGVVPPDELFLTIEGPLTVNAIPWMSEFLVYESDASTVDKADEAVDDVSSMSSENNSDDHESSESESDVDAVSIVGSNDAFSEASV